MFNEVNVLLHEPTGKVKLKCSGLTRLLRETAIQNAIEVGFANLSSFYQRCRQPTIFEKLVYLNI